MESHERIICQWCGGQNTNPTQCMTCGAPLDVRDKVTASGWREAPRLRDMAQFGFDNSSVQVEGEIVPVVEINLAPNLNTTLLLLYGSVCCIVVRATVLSGLGWTRKPH